MKVQYFYDNFLQKELELCSFGERSIARNKHTTKLARYIDKYCVSPDACCLVFEEIKKDSLGKFQIKKADPSYFLMTLYYLKKYPTKYELSGFLDICEETALKKVRQYCLAIQALRFEKIKWIFDNNDLEEDFIVSVDGFHCRIYKPRIEPSTKWFSPKFKKAGLSYELGISIWHNNLVWINGPFPAGTNDITIFKTSKGLLAEIPEGKIVVADEGYRGVPDAVSTRNHFDSAALKEFKKWVKARHESFNAQLKSFAILDQPFRDISSTSKERKKKHKTAFVACCVIIQFDIENARPLFKV